MNISGLEIPDEHLRCFADERRGGQHAGSTQEVNIEHIPSGITVRVDCCRSQYRNRELALEAIAGAITSPVYSKYVG